MTDPLDPDKTRKAFDALRVRVDGVVHKTDSYSLQLEQVRMACTAAESQARVCKLDADATTRLLHSLIEQITGLHERITALEAREADSAGD